MLFSMSGSKLLYSFIMDWPDRNQNNQKQPPDKKNKPKYIAKDEAQQPAKAEQKHPAHKYERKRQKNNDGFNNRKFHERGRQQEFERPKFVEKVSSTGEQTLSCAICHEYIRRKQSIWTCQQCCISVHLKCIKQWIKKVNESKNEVDKKFLLHWQCLQCKTSYDQNMPEYYCFCGKFKNPDNDRDLQPHSCGKPCQRKRGQYCPHLCPQICHSGKCKPCQLQGVMVVCNCGKTQRTTKCSQERAVFQCGKRCQKVLKCGKHKCERNCHNGQCYPCKKKHLVSCYCGKNEDVVDCSENAYACQYACQKLLQCGFHKCERDCHDGPCGPCKKTPELQKTCHCGRYQLMMITQLERQSCKDPIASCGMPCKKKLACGHECSQICHEGKCADCKVLVQQQCRCGSTQRKIECWKTKHAKQQFHCDTICKKKRTCGIHVCNTQCCKFKNYIGPEAHQCQLTCQKILNCEKHTCDMPCHAGLCKKCPVIYSQPQPCPCGLTFLRPPVLCGTITPECDNFCNKQMPCGHKCDSLCHYGPCRCRQQVEVVCRCGRSKIKTTCGREALCLNKCQEILACGHKCLLQCHSGTCVQANKDGCFKKCEKDRVDCGHKCKQICHYGKKCQQFPCQAQILIKCECGHRQTSILCGSQGNNEGIQKKKQILCNAKCQNMKRFDIFYKGKQIYYPNALIQFAFKNFNYLQKVQQKLAKFISESDSHFIQIQFKQIGDFACKSALHNLFQNHYHLNTHFYKHMKSASFTLTQTEHTMIPKPCLSQYVKQVAKGYIKRTNLPFEYTIKFDGEPRQRTQVILKSLKPYIHKYYVQRKDKMVLVHFWSKQDGVEAQIQLQNNNQMIHFYGEQNANKIQELEQAIEMNQIIQTQVKVEQNENPAQQQKTQNTVNNGTEIEKSQKKQQQNLIKKQEEVKTEDKIEEKQGKIQQVGQKKIQKKQENIQKPKIIMKTAKQSSKIIIRKGGPNFIRSQFPPSSQNVQDIYVIDDDELYGDKVDWDKVVDEMIEKKMGIQASQWRIRSLIMVSFFHRVEQKKLKDQFVRIIDLYQKDKEKARRILQIQKLDLKSIQQQMRGDQIYLSDHQPEIMSYIILFNYFQKDKIQVQISDQCAETKQIQQSLQIIKSVQQLNYEQFYGEFKNSGYLLACMMVPFVHQIRQNFLKQIGKSKKRIEALNLWRNLIFDSEEQLIHYCKQNGIQIGKRISKSKKIEQFAYISGELNAEYKKDTKFLEKISDKRSKSYFLEEAKQLVQEKWMTRSFFAFGDFKQSISSKYMLNLCKNLRQN